MNAWLFDYHHTSFRILFQNADNTINMVKDWHTSQYLTFQNIDDLAWFRILADIMLHTYNEVENSSTGKLITLDKKRGCMSCYVELHRLDFIYQITGPIHKLHLCRL